MRIGPFQVDPWPDAVTSHRDAHMAVLQAVLADNSFPWDLCVPSMQARGAYPYPIHWIGWEEGAGTGGAGVNPDRLRLRVRPTIDPIQMYAFGAIVAHELAHVADLHWLGAGNPVIQHPEHPYAAESPRRRALLDAATHLDPGDHPHGWWAHTDHSARPVEGFSVPFTRLFQSNPAYYEHVIFAHRWPDLDQVRSLVLDDITPPVDPDPPEIVDPDPNEPEPTVYSDEPRIGRLNGQAYMIERRDAVPISEADAQIWVWLGRPTIEPAAMPLVLRACNIGPVK
jgi:hypothetical protein